VTINGRVNGGFNGGAAEIDQMFLPECVIAVSIWRSAQEVDGFEADGELGTSSNVKQVASSPIEASLTVFVSAFSDCELWTK
jgi:hypothetical protein